VFYYSVFVTVQAIGGHPTPCYKSILFSISSQEQAPLSKMLLAFRNYMKSQESAMLHCRVITPDDYQEMLKMGVENIKLDLKPRLVQGE
jgi:hypothetical protein